MSIAQSEFWSRLVRSGLADQASCQRYADAFAKSCNDSTASEAKSLASFLVRSGVLSKFQAAKLVQPEDPVLRVGSFVMTGDQPITPFSHWIPVQTPVTDASPVARNGFLLRVPLAGLDETLKGWLACHSEINAETLQAVELSGGAQSGEAEQTVEIFSPLPDGGSLLKVLESKQSLSTRKTVRIGVDLAAALQAIHSSTSGVTLAHGAVGADHVWVTPKGHAVLLRDPSSPARSPRADLSTSWIDRIESPALYAAPELADPAVLPTPASDIYSLGCLLFSLFVGRPAFEGEDDRELFAAHNEDLPKKLIEAVNQGASGNPILRVLAYSMAKDPASRFDSAAAFADALTKAGELSSSKTAAKKEAPYKSPSPKPSPAKPVNTKTAESPAIVSPPPPSESQPAMETDIVQIETGDTETLSDNLPSVESSDAAESPPVAGAPVPPPPPPTESDQTPPLRKRRKRKKNRVPVLAGMMVLPLLMLGLAIALRGRSPQKRPRPRPTPGVVRNVPKVPDSRRQVPSNQTQIVNGYEIVESDRLLWVPPHAADSAPPSLALLPPGPAAIISVPISRLVGSADAAPLTTTFSAEINSLIAMAEKRAGVSKEKIARCTVALFPGKDGWPEVALVINLTEPTELKTLTDAWKTFESRDGNGVIIHAGEGDDSDSFFVGGGEKGKPPEGGKVQRFAVASLERIREIAEGEGGAIPLVRSMQALWKQASVDSDFVALVTPNFLFADGREMLAATVPEFRSHLKSWLIPNVAALSLSATVQGDAFYVEMREIPSGGATSATLLNSLRDSIAAWPDWADNFILNSVPDPSWRLLATRLPLMLRFVGDQTRSTIVGETVVASTYLPVDAGSQVALGTFLAMNTASGSGVMVAQAPVEKPLTVEEILDRPMSISFLQLSLQFSIDAIVEEFKLTLPSGSTMPNVRIVGGDLENDGITQNQSISGFERNDLPLRKVLTDIVLIANPDKTATGPQDPNQALIWVVHPTGKPPGEAEILITTRKAAEANGYELPDEFKIP